MFLKRILTITLAIAMVTGMTACGTGNSADQSVKEGANENKSDTSSGEAGSGRTDLVVANAEEPGCFYPIHTSLKVRMQEVPIIHNIYETMVKLMPDGSNTPLLAESWEISEDGTAYTMHLKQGVKFHNGNPFNAEDVKYSLDTVAPLSGGQQLLVNYESAEIVDDYTVIIHLSAPYGAFINSLCSRYALIVDKETAEEIGEDAYNDAPVGTGPYKFVNRIAGDRIELESNEDYWGGAPSIKKITYRVMADSNSQILALENGEVDAILNANLSPLLKLEDESGISYSAIDAANIAALGLDCNEGPATDMNFRKALQYGINKDDVVMAVYEGKATVADSYLAPSFSGHPDNGSYPVVDFDLEKAKEYLKASNYNGEEFKLVTVSGTKNEVASQVLQGQLIELGVNCKLSAVDSATYFSVTQNGDGTGFDGFLRAGGVSSMDADGLYYLFATNHVATGNRYDAGVSSKELDDLLYAGRIETDMAKRKDIYADALTLVSDKVLHIPLYYDLSVVAYDSKLKGVEASPLVGLYYFNNWSWN